MAVILIDVPGDALTELDDTLHLMASYAAVRERMETQQQRPALARRWNVVSHALKDAADSTRIPQ